MTQLAETTTYDVVADRLKTQKAHDKLDQKIVDLNIRWYRRLAAHYLSQGVRVYYKPFREYYPTHWGDTGFGTMFIDAARPPEMPEVKHLYWQGKMNRLKNWYAIAEVTLENLDEVIVYGGCEE